MTPSQLDALTYINLNDLVASFGWQDFPPLAWLTRHTFLGPARKFARQMVEFDNLVGQSSLAQASRTILQKQYVRDVRVHGSKHIPPGGAALFLSNHPGMADTVSLFAAINRSDLKIIALRRPFLASLTNVTRDLFYISDNASERMRAVRHVSAHLRNGGSVLTFPAGCIEPDPLIYPDALDFLSNWSDSAGVFLRFAPQTRIVPVLVSGVIWEKTARHWLTKLKRRRPEREKLAAALQLLITILRNARPTTVHVQFAEPITLQEVGSSDSEAIHAKIIARMRSLMLNTPDNEGVSAL